MKHPNWPVYELVTVTAPPEMSFTPSSLRVPRQYFAYRADDYLRPFATPDRPNLLQFGRSGKFCIFCLDVTSGEVIHFVVDENDRLQGRDGRGLFVNSSLDQFNRSIEVLIELFPYDNSDNANGDDWDAIAKELSKTLLAIDERLHSEWPNYWDEFYWDVVNGDYGSCIVLPYL